MVMVHNSSVPHTGTLSEVADVLPDSIYSKINNLFVHRSDIYHVISCVACISGVLV